LLPGEEFAIGEARAFRSTRSIARLLKLPTVLLIVGGMLFLSGHGLFAASFFQGTDGSLATIPPGSWLVVYEFKVIGASRVFGQFAAGGLVNVFVFNNTQREIFTFFGFGPSLFTTEAASGSFSASLPGPGTYYLVFAHGDGAQDSGEAIRVTYRVAGIQPELLEVGVPFIALGIVAVGSGLWARKRRPVRPRVPTV